MITRYSLFALLFISLFVLSCASKGEITETPIIASDYREDPFVIENTYDDSNNQKYGYTLVDGMDLKETDRGVMVVFDNPIIFRLSSSKVEKHYDPSFEILNSFVELNSDKITRIIVEGHTDSTGKKSFNQRLSKNRSLNSVNRAAESGVSRVLMRNTFMADSIQDYEGDEAYKNRRAEFFIFGSEDDMTKYNNFLADNII